MNEITNVSNSVNNDNTRGLHNWKNLFKKPTFNDWFTLFIIIMIVFMAWAYQHDTQVCRDSVAIIQDNACKLCTGREMMMNNTGEHLLPTPILNNSIFDNGDPTMNQSAET